MALVTCGECGREVSDRAVVCPHCGNPDIRQPTVSGLTKDVEANADGSNDRTGVIPPPLPKAPKQEKKKTGCGTLILVCLIGFIAIVIFGGISEKTASTAPSSTDAHAAAKVDSKPKSDSVDYAYQLCSAVDRTGMASEPCEVGTPNINVRAAVSAKEARTVCNALVDIAKAQRMKFENWWKIRVISPCSAGSPLATCSLPQ